MIDLRLGDCIEHLKTLPNASVDAVVTDPPYGLKFMGKGWDHGVPGVPYWEAALRVLKPGGYLLAFGGTRTFHRQACRIEDAGFEIRDTINCLSWVYGTGFPKGKGCLKPAWEPVTLARKPGPKVLPLGVDRCRVEGVPPSVPQPEFKSPTGLTYGMQTGVGRNGEMSHAAGRWPPNLLLTHHPDCNGVCADGCPAKALGEQGGERRGAVSNGRRAKNGAMFDPGEQAQRPGFADTGTAARFFPQFHYCPKASRAERGDGNTHPTVKPLDLMRWLVRLVAAPGETVLDPFMGSGTTGVAAAQMGLSVVGIERDPGYFATAERRIAEAAAKGAA